MTWPTVALGRVAKIVGGSTPRRERPEYWGGGIPWLTPTDLPMPGAGILDVTETESTITDKGLASCSANLLPVGAVMFSSRATIGKLGIARTPVATNQGFANFIPGPAIDSKYLAYCLLHRTEQITGLAGSTTFKEVTKTALRKVAIPLPGLSEQRMIVDCLEQADLLRQRHNAVAQRAQYVLLSLFRMCFGDATIWQSLGTTEPLGNLVRSQGGGTPSKRNPDYWDGDIPWVSPKDMKRDFIDDAEDHISDAAVAETTSRLVPLNSILVVVRGMILARHVPLAVNIAPVAINQDMKALTVIDDRVSPLYLFAAMKVLGEQLHASVGTAGHGTRKLDTDRLLSLPIHIPDRKRHDEFIQAFEKIRESNAARATIGPRIQRLFEVLLHRAFTGELTAGWREEHKDQLETEMQEQLAALEAAAAERPKRGRRASASKSSDCGDGARNAGHDMFNKAALVTYIVTKCHDPSRPLGRTKLAKLFYLVQRRAEISLTEQFARRAAGPLDDAIPKVLSLARKNGWVTLAKAQGKLKPVVPGENPQPAIDHVKQRWADGLTVIDDTLATMKGWGWEALERWATVEHAAQQLAADGKPATLDAIKSVIASEPKWKPKLERDAFSDLNIQRTLKGLRDHGYLPAEAGANH